MFRKRKARAAAKDDSTAAGVSSTTETQSPSVESLDEIDLRLEKRPRAAFAREERSVPSAGEPAPIVPSSAVHKTDTDFNQKKTTSAVARVFRGKESARAEGQSGGVKGLSGLLAAPLRATANVRVTNLMDYQPDLCKDFKDTGVCGFGDSCKFIHDRTDYKAGWQLEQEWQGDEGADSVSKKEQQQSALPFACHVCRNPFVDPVKTKCGHYFCEDCILTQSKRRGPGKTACPVCGKDTAGSFTVCTPREVEALERRCAEARGADDVPANDGSNRA